MKESYSEIVAEYADPESYADGGNTVGVVTAGVHPGPDIELRKQVLFECRRRLASGRQHHHGRNWQDGGELGGVEDLAHGWKLQTREPGDPIGSWLLAAAADSQDGQRTSPRVMLT